MSIEPTLVGEDQLGNSSVNLTRIDSAQGGPTPEGQPSNRAPITTDRSPNALGTIMSAISEEEQREEDKSKVVPPQDGGIDSPEHKQPLEDASSPKSPSNSSKNLDQNREPLPN